MQISISNAIGGGGGNLGSGGGSSFTNTKSILLDGVDDFVDCGDADNLSFGDGSNDSPFSISAWVKMSDEVRFRIVSKKRLLEEYYFGTTGGGGVFLALYDESTGGRLMRYGASLNAYLNTWIHLAVTYDGSSSSSGIKGYLNGSLITLWFSADSGSYTAMENTSQPFEIGKEGTYYSDGNIDEVAVFNSELSASDVTAIYNGGVPNDLSSLSPLSWWRCGDGDTSPTLTDNGSAGNNGTMTNFSTFSTDVPT